MILAAEVHLGTKNCDFQMERYLFKRRADDCDEVPGLGQGAPLPRPGPGPGLWHCNKPLCEELDLWGWNSLHYAVELGLEDVVSDMLGLKKSLVYLPTGSENDWTTAIHIAASEGDVNMINKLLNHFPDCWDMRNNNNQNALYVAVLNNQDKVVT
ncbi:putative ankyrin repeat-containing protein-like [Capsicum annuum]|nr:putative ankyrin repeat-containing protein-like [Capsicum annuum]